MPRGQYVRTQFHRDILIKRNKNPEHIAKVKRALKGHGFTAETLLKISTRNKNKTNEKNSNWKGNKVGVIGIHQWLRRNFIKKRICEFCGFSSNNPLRIDWALIKGKKYERKRENFMELCRSCHTKYDRKGFCR